MTLALQGLGVRISPSNNPAARPGETLTLTATPSGGSGSVHYRWSGGFPGMRSFDLDRPRLELIVPSVDRPSWFTVNVRVTDPSTGRTAADTALITVCP